MFVFDLDGTLSIVGDRLKCLQQDPKDWDGFFDRCGEDRINLPIVKVFICLRDVGHRIAIITGRSERVRQKSLIWLDENGLLPPLCQSGLPLYGLIMRPEGDKRPDTIVKAELARPHLASIEDRASVVEMWRELGIPCCQVAKGDF